MELEAANHPLMIKKTMMMMMAKERKETSGPAKLKKKK